MLVNDDIANAQFYCKKLWSHYPRCQSVGWLVVLGLAALLDSISVYLGPSPREREKEERKDRGE